MFLATYRRIFKNLRNPAIFEVLFPKLSPTAFNLVESFRHRFATLVRMRIKGEGILNKTLEFNLIEHC